MVRVNTHASSDSNKDSLGKRKSTARAKKTAPITGVWPCKINGCNKEFAREADLKRHQRTTKLHSLPNFSCPQCEATFTRPDALRRHQKSRHNGVVIEPKREHKKQDTDVDEVCSSESPSGSRSASATPSSKGKERAEASEPMKYYRSHTTTSSSYISSRPPVMNPQYDQVALPTSATRLNSSPNWSYSHPWPEHRTLPPIGYSHGPMYYTPSPHYRIDGPPPMLHPVSQISNSRSKSKVHESSSRTTLSNRSSTSYTSSERTTTEQGDTSAPSSPSAGSGIHMIDPSLDGNEAADPSKFTEEQVRAISLEITQAAMKAVIESAKQEAEARSSAPATCKIVKRPLHDKNPSSTTLRPIQAVNPKLMGEEKLNIGEGPVKRVTSIDVHMSSGTGEPRGRVNADIDDINDYDSNAEPPRSAEQLQLMDNDDEAMLSPGSSPVSVFTSNY
ncbi:hypothetical protein AX15_000637 [Amanita polypyramis BW_CC]|nr:hypothetical protein AX15_000637 [Amanita polypyramis BW_CC]